jgi:hypothetical protein
MMFPIYAVDQVPGDFSQGLPQSERARSLSMSFRKTCSSTHGGKLHFATNAGTHTGFAWMVKTEISGCSSAPDVSLNWECPSDQATTVRAMREMCIALQARCIGFDA